MSKATQNSKVLHYLEQHGSITPREAMKFGCMRLAARIKDLRTAGHKINREMVSMRDEDGEIVRYARYRKAV